MPFQNSPTSMFLGHLTSREKNFVKNALKAASESGYERFVEPCSGELAMSYLAKGLFKTMEASDIMLYPSVVGCVASGRDCSELGVLNRGRAVSDPAEIIYGIMCARAALKAGSSIYQDEILREFERSKEKHISKIRKKTDALRDFFKGCRMSYEPMDMLEHLAKIRDDPKAVAVVALPTYKNGYEKLYDTGGAITWKEPAYEIFDPKDKGKLRKLMEGAQCLAFFYEETEEAGETAFPPIFACDAAHGFGYITVSDLGKYGRLLGRKEIAFKSEQKLARSKYPLLPTDFSPRFKDEVSIVGIASDECDYYRSLFTHNFVGGEFRNGLALTINGMLAGVFGIATQFAHMSVLGGGEASDEAFLAFAMHVPLKGWRLGRLFTMLGLLRSVAQRNMSDFEKETLTKLATTMISKYPESKQMRGLMTMSSRKYDAKAKTYMLKYSAPLTDGTVKGVYREWISKEERFKASSK